AQGHRPLDRPTTGLGIGLALVRRLVEMHGGSVVVQSDGPQCGTRVGIRLPLLDGFEVALPALTPAPARRIEPARLLVVDDNRDAADVLAAMLRLAGHHVEIADDGLEALRMGEAFAPDVALIDLGMPKLNGFETARQIRQQPWGRHVSLVAVTGW